MSELFPHLIWYSKQHNYGEEKKKIKKLIINWLHTWVHTLFQSGLCVCSDLTNHTQTRAQKLLSHPCHQWSDSNSPQIKMFLLVSSDGWSHDPQKCLKECTGSHWRRVSIWRWAQKNFQNITCSHHGTPWKPSNQRKWGTTPNYRLLLRVLPCSDETKVKPFVHNSKRYVCTKTRQLITQKTPHPLWRWR